jgi:hypothetical protein
VAEEHTAEKIAQLEQEIEVLKKENERLRRLPEEALGAATSGSLLAAETQSPAPKTRMQSRKAVSGAAIAGPFPTRLMKLSRYRCRLDGRDAEAGWKSAKPFLSSKPRFRNRGWSALSFAFCRAL